MSPPDLDGLSAAALKALVLKLLSEVSALKQVVAEQRAEIARLKGLKGPPSIKPSGMEQASEAKPAGSSRRPPRGSTRSKLSIDEERTVKVATPPRGSRFKGYTSFLVQDLVATGGALLGQHQFTQGDGRGGRVPRASRTASSRRMPERHDSASRSPPDS